MKKFLALFLLLAYALPASASVAFEDHTPLPKGTWELNTIGSYYPNSLKVEQGVVAELDPDASVALSQLAQEFRYGVTDWLMVRTTLTLGMLQQNRGNLMGIGDLEGFVKAQVLDAPFHLALGLQITSPTAIPSVFSVNGSTNIIPSLMLTHEGSYGSLNLTTSYSWGTNQMLGGKSFHPSDTLFLGLAYNRDFLEDWTFTLETMAAWDYSSQTNGIADPNTANTQVSVGPGITWQFLPGHSLQASLQLPCLRRGTMPSTQPAFGFLQYSRDF